MSLTLTKPSFRGLCGHVCRLGLIIFQKQMGAFDRATKHGKLKATGPSVPSLFSSVLKLNETLRKSL